jgi:hypothetical protein
MSMIGRWAPLYEGVHERRAYGAYSPTYKAAAEWLAPCVSIEDWGGGLGWFRNFIAPNGTGTGTYRLVDGTANDYVHEVADLTSYRPVTKPEGILLRHVAEHNLQWRAIIDNLLASFTKRAVVVVYTPFTDEPTHDLGDDTSGLRVPTISFNSAEFHAALEPVYRHHRTFYGATCGHYGIETLFQLEQP